ncbi:MAG: leucine-rich repeat protein [Kiritimatiellae bacterium]|nr:leucine-rich repeat protein [Kiritimatiellia bacterium]
MKMRGAKYILALTLAMAGASALAHNGGYENGNLVDVAGYAGYGEDTTETATPTGDDALTMLYAQCKALKSLDLSQVGAIGDAAFAYSAVTSIVLTANISSVGYISFGGCSNLTEVSCDSWNWANGTANIEDKEPFRDCFKLTTLRVSGDAASPPESFSVTNTFDVLTTVYCPTSTVSAWEAAYPSLTIIGDPELAPSPAPAPAPVHTLLSLTNGTVSAAFSLPSPDDADAYAETNIVVVLTGDDEEAGLITNYLRAVIAPAANEGEYYAYVDVNPDTVPAPIIGSSTDSPMPVVQYSDGVKVDISVCNAIQGLWYGCEVKDSLSDPFVYDVDSFDRAPADGVVVIPCTKRTSEAAFFRVRVTATKPE